MPLSDKQTKHLRALAHQRKPIVIVGAAGITDALIGELDAALSHHELVKVRVNAGDRDARRQMTEEIRRRTASELVQTIGHVATYFRRAEKPVITLP